MYIFLSPDNFRTSSLMPELDAIECQDLEQITGADMVISSIPIMPTSDLQEHIDNHSLFVQIKIGYDILSFDALKNAIIRMRACRIPIIQSVLLFVGRYDGASKEFRIPNKAPYGDATVKTFYKIRGYWSGRGGSYDQINSVDELPLWIESRYEAIQDMLKEPIREIYPEKSSGPLDETDRILQDLIEVKDLDWRRVMVSGLDGFGPVLAKRVQEYLQEQGLMNVGYYALKVLTDQDIKGKAVHKIAGWGKEKIKTLRDILGLTPGYNLSLSDLSDPTDYGVAFRKGVYSALDDIEKRAINQTCPACKWNGHPSECKVGHTIGEKLCPKCNTLTARLNGEEAIRQLRQQANEFFKE